MRYTLRLQWRCNSGYMDRNRPWVARILGLHCGYFVREFVRGQIDYNGTDGESTRFPHLYFHLPDGLYEADFQQSWKRRVRFYCTITNGKSQEITEEDAVRIAIEATARDRCTDGCSAAD